jgi:toxin ParE1/3/4
MRLELHPEALVEYEGAVTYYEDRQPGLGGRFVAAVEVAFDSIRENPARYPFLAQDVQRRLTRVFPYAVLYTVEPEYILVIAVMHCHQAPGYWRSRADG